MTPKREKKHCFDYENTEIEFLNVDNAEILSSVSPLRTGQASPADMQLQVALYIESMTAELRILARGANLEGLAYFLEMARIEASIQVEKAVS